ncbi:hypothetical protein [Streptomyces sp. NPDC096193]|uniref:hypothetical protein n=1 Tax=Streptomyces sp. NPDC096193 TaxID=3155821 RepID=UPI003325E55C
MKHAIPTPVTKPMTADMAKEASAANQVGAAPLHLALVFNLSHTTASRYAAIAQDLLDDQSDGAL